ncbi:MAG: hypothetical protein ACO30K_17975, partial [bacterium]
STSNELERVINYVIDTDESQWKSVVHSYRESIMPFDFGNARLSRLLETIGIDVHGPGTWEAEDIPKN